MKKPPIKRARARAAKTSDLKPVKRPITSAKRPSTSLPRRRPRLTSIQPKAPIVKPTIEAAAVTAGELRALKRELERRTAPARWNPDPEDVQKSVVQLVLTLVEFLRQLMERQAIRRMEARTLTPKEVEAVGTALMQLEATVGEIAARFGIKPEELNLDLGAIKLL